ncbi:MAG: zinc ribbon domain-containing protein [Chloroflexi bacterium]|nr:zinc ribbon domain-containing protein [Chloroflexota bacterium]
MDQILGTIGSAIGSVLDNPVIKFGFQIVAIYWAILWLAAAYWAFRDMQLRSENPIAPYLSAAFVIAFTPLLFPLAVFAYRIVRPQERIGEIYERNLAEEAMLAEIEAVRHCPTCDRTVHSEWIICPTCRTRLNRVCPNCSKLVGLDWSLCAWCGRDFERPEIVATSTISSSARQALGAGEATAAVRSAIRPADTRPTRSRSGDSLAES